MDRHGRVVTATTVTTDQEIMDLLMGEGDTWVGVDASLIINNENGLRPCEKRLRKMGVRVLPTNRTFINQKFGGSRGESLVERLKDHGYVLSEGTGAHGRCLFEVFPHGTLHLLSGGHRPNYKKGGREQRSQGRREVIATIGSWEPTLEPPSILLGEKRNEKELEDILDAWVCVACVYSHWLNGDRTTQMIGEEGDGHILLGCHRYE